MTVPRRPEPPSNAYPRCEKPSNESRLGGPATAVGSSPLPRHRPHVHPFSIVTTTEVADDAPDVLSVTILDGLPMLSTALNVTSRLAFT